MKSVRNVGTMRRGMTHWWRFWSGRCSDERGYVAWPARSGFLREAEMSGRFALPKPPVPEASAQVPVAFGR